MHTMTRLPSAQRARRERGFSLIELAIAIGVMGVLFGAMLVPLVTQLQQRNVSMTEKTLADIKDALLGFAAVNGRLPCPAVTPTPVGAQPGAENFDTANGGNAANGKCLSNWGFVPARTLGITPVDANGFALDAWATTGNRIRYAVASDTIGTVTNPLTASDGIKTATLASVAAAPPLLYVCDSGSGVAANNCNAARTLTSNAVVVIWSVGGNASTGGTGTDEAQNPNPRNEGSTDRIFVSHAATDITGNPYDDIVTWVSINTLVNRLVGAGQLP